VSKESNPDCHFIKRGKIIIRKKKPRKKTKQKKHFEDRIKFAQ